MEGALDWALPQQGGGRGEGPQVVPRSLLQPGEKEAFHHLPPHPTIPHILSPGVDVLGSLPGPEGGISWGWLILCPSQTEELL